jgi:hypothetical protein
MFDASTGTLTFERPPTVIPPTLTRDQFLGSSLSDGATTHVENVPYHSWKLNGTFRSAEIDLLVVLYFRDQQLTMLNLMDPDPRFGTSWADHSLEKEMARKASMMHGCRVLCLCKAAALGDLIQAEQVLCIANSPGEASGRATMRRAGSAALSYAMRRH